MTQSNGQPQFVLSRAGYGFLALLLAFASISTDLYLPAMPTMTEALGTSHGRLELTISAYLLGFAFGQLFWGPYSDHRGRRVPLAMGLVLFVIGAIGCALAPNVAVLIIFRIVQATGASAAVVIGRAIVRDLFEGKEAARVLSTLTAIMVIAPMVGPVIGARILAIGSWPNIFFTLAAVGLITLVLMPRVIEESLPLSKRLTSGRIIDPRAYLALLRNRKLRLYAMVVFVHTAGVFAYVAGSSFAFITHQGLSSDAFGLVFAIGSIAIMAANMLNARLVSRVRSDTMLVFGLIITLFSAGGFILTVSLDGPTWLLVLMVVVWVGCNGFVTANAVSGGLNSVSSNVGRASALLGFGQYGGGMVGSLILGLFSNSTLWPLASLLFLASLGALVVALRVHGIAD